jgi:hypothetical protein
MSLNLFPTLDGRMPVLLALLPDPPPVVVATIFWVLAGVGAMATLVFGLRPRAWSEHWAWDLLPKGFSEGAQWLCGGVAAWGTYRIATEAKPDWLHPMIAALVSQWIWKVTQHVADYRNRAATRSLEMELQRAEREGARQARILTVLGACVHDKITRISRVLGDLGGGRRSIDHAREALTPAPHLESLLNSLSALFLEQAREEGERNAAFRLGVYIARDGAMQPLYGIDTQRPGYNPFTSFNQHRAFFQVAGEGPRSHVVRCVRERTLLIVQDCQAESDRGRFVFFNDHQRSYLRSMVAFYLGQVRGEGGTLAPAALVIDTPLAGFFNASERASIEFCLREFGRRVALELCLVDLLTNR